MKTIFLIAVSLALGVLAGFFAGRGGGEAETLEYVPAGNGKRPIPAAGAQAGVKALRRRIAELEKALADGAASGAGDSGASTERKPPERESHRERMARLEKENPARYATITNRIATWRRRRAESARNRMDFLSSIDVSQMTDEDRKVHEDLQRLIMKREDIESELHQPEIDDAQRRRLFAELRATGAEMNELSAKERDNLLSVTARNLGFEGEDAAEIVATIKEVVEATESGWGPGRGFGSGRGPSPGGRQR